MPKQAIALLDDLREAAAIDRHGDPSAARRAAALHRDAGGDPGGRAAARDARRSGVPRLPPQSDRQPRHARAREPRTASYRCSAAPSRCALPGRAGLSLRRVRAVRALALLLPARVLGLADLQRQRAVPDRERVHDRRDRELRGARDHDRGASTTPTASSCSISRARAAPRRCGPAAATSPRSARAWVRELADREGLHDAWSLATRDDVRFEDGTGALRFVDGGGRRSEVVRGQPSGHAGRARHRGRCRSSAARTSGSVARPTCGSRCAPRSRATRYTPTPDSTSRSTASWWPARSPTPLGGTPSTTTVARDRLTGGWHDLYLVFSSVADPGRDLRPAPDRRLESVEWSAP